jgi:hypothetical protein
LLLRLQLGLRVRQLVAGSQAAGSGQAVKVVQQAFHAHTQGMRQPIRRLLLVLCLCRVLLQQQQAPLLLALLRLLLLLQEELLLQC